ncbi:MAG: alginate O-acetyltransferase [Proteobacteria bacterium]|nr:alginate O-acetyltransferase [Pseudomonadota bacterium]
MKLFRILLLGFSLCVCALAAQASEKAALDKAYCPALANEASYAKWLVNYKMLVRGKDDWLFRTTVASKTDFAVEEKTIALLKQLQDRLKTKGTDFVILLPPTQGGAVNGEFLSEEAIKKYGFTPVLAKQNYTAAIASLKTAGINAVGVTDYPEGKAFFYRRDHHWSPDGAKASAKKLAEFVKTLPAYASLPKTSFVTKEIGKEDYKGAYVKAFMTVCKKRPPAEKAPKFKTEPAEQKSGEADLFGDNTEPPVVLVGTSNSAPTPNVSNFDGFLKEALSLDVENLAIAGAGVDSSLLSYLNSAQFKKAPAKILVWEVPGYYDLNKVVGPVLLQAIPAVAGDCKGKALAEVAVVDAKSGETELLNGLGAKNIADEKQFIRLEFSKAPKKPFVVEYWSGNRRSMGKLARDARYPTPTDAFLQIIQNGNSRGAIESVVLKLRPGEDATSVSARICALE